MKIERILLVVVLIAAVWLIAAVTYNVTHDQDPYQHFSGLGDSISISPDDKEIVFSYFSDGAQSIYRADADGKHVKKWITSKDHQLNHPRYSGDGKQMLYLAEGENGVSKMYTVNRGGEEGRQISPDKIHVSAAAYAPDKKRIYYIGMSAKDYSKMAALGAEDEKSPSPDFDIYSIATDGSKNERLTSWHAYMLTDLQVSPDGKVLYVNHYDGGAQGILTFNLKEKRKGRIAPAAFSGAKTGDTSVYSPVISPDGKYMTFSAVSKESQHSSRYQYDLFQLHLKEKHVRRLTDLKAKATSPVYFHHQPKVAFLKQENWSNDPAVYRLETVELDNQKVSSIQLDVPDSSKSQIFGAALNWLTNVYTIAGLYSMIFVCLTLFYRHKRKKYFPAIISFILALLMFLASISTAVIFGEPWMGIGMGMIAAGMFVCSFFPLLAAVIMQLLMRTKK